MNCRLISRVDTNGEINAIRYEYCFSLNGFMPPGGKHIPLKKGFGGRSR